jgi:hypothetical protein
MVKDSDQNKSLGLTKYKNTVQHGPSLPCRPCRSSTLAHSRILRAPPRAISTRANLRLQEIFRTSDSVLPENPGLRRMRGRVRKPTRPLHNRQGGGNNPFQKHNHW